MNRNAIAGIVAAAVLIAGVLYFTRAPVAKTARDAKDVTKTGKAGSLTTTPIKTSQVAVVSKPGLLGRLTETVAAVRTRVSSAFQHSGQDVLQPYGSDASARAASAAPLRPEYKVNALATKENVIALRGYR